MLICIFNITALRWQQSLLFCRILKSGESSMTFPSLYQTTRGDGIPFTRLSSTTSWPSDARRSCRLWWDTRGYININPNSYP